MQPMPVTVDSEGAERIGCNWGKRLEKLSDMVADTPRRTCGGRALSEPKERSPGKTVRSAPSRLPPACPLPRSALAPLRQLQLPADPGNLGIQTKCLHKVGNGRDEV